MQNERPWWMDPELVAERAANDVPRPPLQTERGVVTHAPMESRTITNSLLALIAAVLIFGGGYWFVQSQNTKAIEAGDYGACMTDACKSAVSDGLIKRLNGY